MQTSSTSKSKAILRWAGSKLQLLPVLAEFWESKFERYVEPFAGSARLFFEIEPKSALLGDKNAELIEVYSVLRDSPDELHEAVLSIPKSKEAYYEVRGRSPAELTELDRAARFIYLNRYCFNGLYRTNLQGQFNVPYAPKGTGRIPELARFRVCAKLLMNARLRHWDFGTTLRYVRAGDFVYIDPPFVVESRRVFSQYGPGSFTNVDLSRLARHLKVIDRKGAVFVLSYADCREARELSRYWHRKRLRVRRNIAGFASARRNAYELIVSNLPI
jgi:DNA adenine methylase